MFDYKLVEYYDENNEVSLADALMEVIDEYSLDETEQLYFDNFNDYRILINQWKTSNVNITNLDSMQLSQLSFFSELNNNISAKARGLQQLNDINTYQEPVYFPTIGEKSYSGDEKENNIFKESNLMIYPNPTEDYFTIDYSLVESFDKAIVIIYNMNGKEVYKKELKFDQDQLIISTENFNSGIYSCSIFIDGKSINSKKITIMK